MNSPFRLPFNASRHAGLTTPLRLLLATTTALWMGAAQPQVPAPVVPRQVTELRFREFFRSPVGSAGAEISDALRQSDGQTVRLMGYMVQQQNLAPGRFMLTPRPTQMSENAQGDADDFPPATVMVYLDADLQSWKVPYVHGLVTVSGKLSITRHKEIDGRVSWVRLQLGPDATRSMNAFELAGYLHSL